VLAGACAFACITTAATPTPGLTIAPDTTGSIGIHNTAGATDTTNPFFQSLGSNGRSCLTCHVASNAMSFTPNSARQRYTATHGADPLFASVDGANCSSVAANDRAGHSLILNSGLIRIALAVPVNAEYSISVVHDPYQCGLGIDPKSHVLTASVYRRTHRSVIAAIPSGNQRGAG
jgi:hypothetical protein